MKRRWLRYAAILVSPLLFSPQALAQCELNLQTAITSGWHKDKVTYTIAKNKLNIQVAENSNDDADSIYLGSVRNCKTLTIDVLALSGRYPWGGKIVGFSFFNDKLAPDQWGNQASFPAPRNRAIDDGFVAGVSTENGKLVYDLTNGPSIVHFGAKVFVGGGNRLELGFSVDRALPQVEAGARQIERPLKRYIANAGRRRELDPTSCSSHCHEPRSEDKEFDFIADFSIPPGAGCPHRDD